MRFEKDRVLRKGHSRRRYGAVDAAVTARLSEEGDELLLESRIPVSRGWSDVCFVLPVDALPDLVRLALARQSSAS